LKEEDSGHYICNGNNSIGHNRDYVYIGVVKAEEQVQSAPANESSDNQNDENIRISEESENEAGKTIILECKEGKDC
jgi:hypothetical protein